MRLEALVVLMASVLLYKQYQFDWWFFLVCFFVPDVSIFAYVFGTSCGAIAYNCAHSYIGASIVCMVGLFLNMSVLLSVGLIWVAHIGFDRFLGYGLKSRQGFKFTHLGQVGK
ncbi:DUF4260 domain-containing protein [Neisseria sp. Ec49-e6-T10]|uniref:DUF4260 domain-containing protein n=1 Tax=Neisseria sp. Ec49-e6-T10 TaxID=3140744 RepID=UPI003EBC2559